MIKPAKENHREQMISLWSNAFGDSKDSVNRYLDTLLDYFLVYEEDSIVKGMLSVLPVTLNDKNGGYIYAVVTHPDFREKGICRALIDTVKANANYDFLVLVPQKESLFEFYKNMEFSTVSFLKQGEIFNLNAQENYSLNTISAKEYETIRNEYYKNESFIKWDKEILQFAEGMYNGKFCKILKDEKNIGFAFLYKENETVFIKELLCENHEEAVKGIGRAFDCKKVNYVYESRNANPTFMVYPREFSNTKFGIFLD